jgi:hypothetical protein
MREIHDHMRIREESNILNSANQQNPKKNEWNKRRNHTQINLEKKSQEPENINQ